MSKIRYQLIAAGRVQGVGFRYFCQTTADTLGISGWARNRSDGTVEIEAQGEKSHIHSFLTKIGRGPALSQVSELHKNEIPLQADESSFTIKY